MGSMSQQAIFFLFFSVCKISRKTRLKKKWNTSLTASLSSSEICTKFSQLIPLYTSFSHSITQNAQDWFFTQTSRLY
jgi:hypothetical protein